MFRNVTHFALATTLIACGGSSEPVSQSDDTQIAGAGDEQPADTTTETTTEATEPVESTDTAATTASTTPAQPSFEGTITEATVPLLEALADGRVGWDRVTSPDGVGILVAENFQGEEGLVQRARHYCHRMMTNQIESLKTQLAADIARGRELNDSGCTAMSDPARTDCGFGGTEETPVAHYVFVESPEGVQLQAIYRISEVGQTERYVVRATTYANRQAAMARRGCTR